MSENNIDYKARMEINDLLAKVTELNEKIAGLEQTLQVMQSVVEARNQSFVELQLDLETFECLFQARLGISNEEIAAMRARVDLADGFEDGRIGPNLVEHAPRCPRCGRPLNPKRHMCLFCNTAIDGATAAVPVLPPKQVPYAAHSVVQPRAKRRGGGLVHCSRCGQEVPQSNVYFSPNGMICRSCWLG
jgi:hypothetical protein